MINAYFIANFADGCYYYRCYLPLLHNGWDGSYISMRSGLKSSEQQAREVMKQQVVVFHRPSDVKKLELAKMLKSQGIKIVFDNDDTYKELGDNMNFKDVLAPQNAILEEFMGIADLCTTTTDFLAEEYRRKNRNVIVLPNFIDPDDWETPKRNKGDKVRIGLVGSVTHNSDYAEIKPLLEKLSKDNRVQLVIMGMRNVPEEFKQKMQDEIDFWESLNVEWVESVRNYKYQEALNDCRLDVMLIPRLDNYFNRCKSNCKFLEASMLEIPVIGQSFPDGLSPYDNNPVVRTASSLSEWETEVERLITDKELRRKLGKDAKKYVLKNYNIKDKYKLWEEAYKSILQ